MLYQKYSNNDLVFQHFLQLALMTTATQRKTNQCQFPVWEQFFFLWLQSLNCKIKKILYLSLDFRAAFLLISPRLICTLTTPTFDILCIQFKNSHVDFCWLRKNWRTQRKNPRDMVENNTSNKLSSHMIQALQLGLEPRTTAVNGKRSNRSANHATREILLLIINHSIDY